MSSVMPRCKRKDLQPFSYYNDVILAKKKENSTGVIQERYTRDNRPSECVHYKAKDSVKCKRKNVKVKPLTEVKVASMFVDKERTKRVKVYGEVKDIRMVDSYSTSY